MDLRRISSLFVFFIFLSFVFASSLLVVYGSFHESSSDRDSLLAFRSKISHDPLRIFNSWNETTHFCNWTGVTCGRRHRSRVTKLDLVSRKLGGTLSPHIGNLSFLRELRLADNNFTHEIPQELGALFRLESLSLENNSFSGEIPTNLSRCSNLHYLNLIGNDLGGELPSELEVLSKLQTLRLSINSFVGKIPPSFGNLSSLKRMSGSYNKLYGSIPSTLAQLTFLEILSFGANKLSGPISQSIFNISSLTYLALPKNDLNGSLPLDIGLTLPKLKTLFLYENQLSGHIPLFISNLTSLQEFDIFTNRFTGHVPYLGGLRDLRVLSLSKNELGNGEEDDLNFMSSLLSCTNLEKIGLSDNNFGGIMPEFLSNFSKQMRQMTFGRNQIKGRISSEIGNLINLERLGLEDNLLTGNIPSSIGKLQNLFGLNLYSNKLYGQIPSSIGNLSSLGDLYLSRNKLQENIPPSIGRCSNLKFIHLDRNSLSGTIPKELFNISSSIELRLSQNSLTGSLPQEIGNLVNLGVLFVSDNNLSGELPQSLGSCTSLEELYLGGNFFHGKIPSSFNSLRGLQRLDLSRNNLSGQVPNYFEKFDLLYLNLSWNDFEGHLPGQGIFGNLTAFSVTGNRKLCSGVPELNLRSCISKKSKASNLKLIVSLVSIIVGIILVSFIVFIYLSRKNKKLSRKSISSINTSIPKVSYDDLLKATNGFSSSNLIGVGGFGSVYKGILGKERSIVAVKVLNLAKKGATKSFMAECDALRSIRHRNLMKIITACSSVDFKGNDFKALVYEFMINGSLEDWLHPDEQKYLTFVQRLHIIVDVANALDYLHNECQTPIVHCDLKPSNILMNEDMVARVGDFGLARLCPQATHQFSSTQSSSLGIKGSIGYAAPEYGMGSEVSTYGDVYSFGILLLETFTGKRPTDSMFKDGLDLHNFAKMAFPEKVMFILDPIQFESNDQYRSDKFCDCIISIVKLGVACSVEAPRKRVNMKMVVEELVHIKNNLLQAGVHLVDLKGSSLTHPLKQQEGTHLELVTKDGKASTGWRLGEDISNLIAGTSGGDTDSFQCYFLTYKIKVYPNMFGPCMKYRFSRHVSAVEAKRFCEAFQRVYKKLVYEELSLDDARSFINSAKTSS